MRAMLLEGNPGRVFDVSDVRRFLCESRGYSGITTGVGVVQRVKFVT